MDKILGPFDHLSDAQLEQVLKSWNSSYPVGIYYKDLHSFKEFLNPLIKPKHYIQLSMDNDIIAWMMTFDREQERWFSIIISEDFKGRGFGKKMIEHISKNEPPLNGWVVDHNKDIKADGSAYLSPLNFYLKLGFQVLPRQRFEKIGISCVKVVLNKD